MEFAKYLSLDSENLINCVSKSKVGELKGIPDAWQQIHFQNDLVKNKFHSS